MKRKKKEKHAIFILLPVSILFLWIILPPITINLVDPSTEDVAKYVAALKLAAEKDELQKTLPNGTTVVDVYGDSPKYLIATKSCNWAYIGGCAHIVTGPGPEFPKAYLYYENLGPIPQVARLGQVFPMIALIRAADDSLWYKIKKMDDTDMTFPERIKSDWYVPAEDFSDIDFTPVDPEKNTDKKIVINLGEQTLYAYEGDELFMKTRVSTGQSAVGLATDTGDFHIFDKRPMTVMDGPLPSMVSMMNPENIKDFEYTLFVPFAMAFEASYAGVAYIHEAYWHNGFGTERSHGCVNVSIADAQRLYNWVPDPATLRIPVTVVP